MYNGTFVGCWLFFFFNIPMINMLMDEMTVIKTRKLILHDLDFKN